MNRKKMKPALRLVRLSLIPLIFLILICFFLGRTGYRDSLYNSDHVSLFLFTGNLIRDPQAVFHWHFGPSLSAFPDWLLGAMVVALPLPGSWVPLVYGAVLMFLYSLAGAGLLATTGKISFERGTWFTAALLVCAGLATIPFPSVSTWLYSRLPTAMSHSGAILATLIASAYFLTLLQRLDPKCYLVLLGFGLLIAATSFSDLLFCIWFVGPACVTSLLLAYSVRQRRELLLAVLMLFAALLGWGLQQSFHRIDDDYISHNRALGSLELTTKILYQTLTQATYQLDVPFLLILTTTLAVLVRGLMLSIRALSGRSLDRGQIMELLMAGICASAIAAPLAADVIIHKGHLRYFGVLPVVSLLWLGYRMLRFADNRSGDLIAGIPAKLSLLAAIMAVPAWSDASRLTESSALQRCLVSHDRTTGLSDHWLANKIMLESDYQIQLLPTKYNGEPSRWGTDERWFSHRADTYEQLQPDFVIPDRLNPEALRKVFGKPYRIIICGQDSRATPMNRWWPDTDGETEVWLYDKALSFAP